MALVDPSSAIIAKARSKYGKRLRDKDYNAMVKCESVGEVVQYLKTYTYYRTFLDKVSNDIHRGNLENILREKQFESILTFSKYNTGNTPVTRYILRASEIDELMKFLTLLSINRPHEYLFSLPLFFNRHTEIPLKKLSLVNSNRELITLLEHTDYAKIIEKHPPNENGDYDLAAVEDDLENYNLDVLYTDIGKIKNKKDREQLRSLFDTLTDFNNYTRIMRLKKYYRLSNEEVRDHLLHYGTLTGNKLNNILRHDSYEEVREALSQTSVGKKAQKIDIMSEMAVQGKFDLCRHQLYFSSNSEIVLLAYYVLSVTELSNVIAIVEGVRYAMSPESISEILIR